MSTKDNLLAGLEPAVDEKMREVWGLFGKRWIKNKLREVLPPAHVTVMECDFIVHPHDNWTEFRLWETGELPEQEATQELADRFKGESPFIVDVGANAGAFTLPILRQCAEDAELLAFEPNPEMIRRLNQNITLNGFENVMIFDCAVGAEAADVTLNFPTKTNMGQARVSVEYSEEPTMVPLNVKLRPLAECLIEVDAPQVDLLKVDVEGLEDRVIVPLLEDVRVKNPKAIYFEIAHDRLWDMPLIDTLKAADYAQTKTYGPNALFELSN